MTWQATKIKTISIACRPARETACNQGSSRANRMCCQELIEIRAKEMKRALKFGGLRLRPMSSKVVAQIAALLI